MLILSKRLLWSLLVLNWVAVVAFAGLAVLLLTPSGTAFATAGLTVNHGAVAAAVLVAAAPWLLALGIAVGFAAHIVFRRMIGIVESAIAGDPFVAANAARLRTIGWAWLAIQILDLGVGYLSYRVAAAGADKFDWSLSLGGWLSVLMIFVLARVFEQGTRMRDDLAMTV